MKITLAEFERTDGAPPLEMFTQGIKAEETREKYTRTLRRVLCNIFEEILEGTFEERAAQLVRHGRENPDWVRDLLLNLSKKLRARTELARNDPNYFNPSSISNYFKPIKKLLDMNDVSMPWARIYATFPEQDNVPDSRGWTRAEISRMLRFASGTTDRALILLAASSGIRMGGFDLDWGDMKPVYRDGDKLSFEGSGEPACAMLSIYRGTSSQYPAFITPEACRALADHRTSWARETGRQPEPSDPMFKQYGPLPRRATQVSMKKRIQRMMSKADLRSPELKNHRRFKVPMMNGFRRFWNKACKESMSPDSPLASLVKTEFMMGHKGLISLDKNYFQVSPLELAAEYLHAVPNLTIGDEERLAAESERRAERIAELEQDKDEIKELRAMVEQLSRRMK